MNQETQRKITTAEMLKIGPSDAAQKAFYRKPYSTEEPDIANIIYERELQGKVVEI